MAVRVFEISNLIKKSEIFSTQSIYSHSFRIRVRYCNINYLTKKFVSKILRDKGFQQVGNTSSWVQVQKNAERWRHKFIAEDKVLHWLSGLPVLFTAPSTTSILKKPGLENIL